MKPREELYYNDHFCIYVVQGYLEKTLVANVMEMTCFHKKRRTQPSDDVPSCRHPSRMMCWRNEQY